MKPADVSGKRANRARGGVSPDEAFAINQAQKPPEKRHVSPDLHPAVFDHRAGLNQDDAHDPNLAAAQRSFGEFSRVLGQLHDREVAIRSDPTRTASDHALRVSKMAGDAIDPVAKRSQAARDRLVGAIKDIDREIDRAKRARLSQPEQQEIRGYVRGLTDGQRRKFLASADDDTTTAVLAGKPYLSGLGPAEAQKIEHEWLTRRFSDEYLARRKYQAAVEQLDAGWQRYLNAVGALRDPEANTIQRRMEAADAAVKEAVHLNN